MIFEGGTPFEDAVQGDFERDAKVKGDVGQDGETIKLGHPVAIYPADGIARQRGEKVAVGEDDIAGAEEREDLPLVAIGEICGVDERERGRGEKLALFAFGGGLFDKNGGIPLGKENAVAFEFEPAFDEVNLGGLA